MAKLIASMKLNVSYDEDTSVMVKRFPTEFEIQILSNSPHIFFDEEKKIMDNEITIKIFKEHCKSVSKLNSGGKFEFNEIIPPSIYIDIKTKYADGYLNRKISKITRVLCKNHLKPATIFPSRYTTNCRISSCQINNRIIELFLQDFCKELHTSIKNGFIYKDKQAKKYNEMAFCQCCHKKLPYLESLIHYNTYDNVEEIYCPSCFDMENKNNELVDRLSNQDNDENSFFSRIIHFFKNT